MNISDISGETIFSSLNQDEQYILSHHEKMSYIGCTDHQLTPFQAFCRSLTCLETFSNIKTEQIGIERWNAISTDGKKQWLKVSEYFATGQLLQDKLAKIRSKMLNNKNYLFGTVSDEHNQLCNSIINGECEFSVWTNLYPDKSWIDFKKDNTIW